MITELPTRADFENTGIALLNLAWQSILGLALNLVDARVDEWEEDLGPDDDPAAASDVVAVTADTLDTAYAQVKDVEEVKAARSLWVWYATLGDVQKAQIGDFETGWGLLGRGKTNEATRQYWESSQQELATAVALAQQGTEFLLKGHIAEVSPFLLLTGGVREWPGGCETADTPFSEFKTIDAQDLPRAHDTVCSPRLPADFKERFEQLRRVRNSIMHTVNRRAQFTTRDGVLAILEVVDFLVGQRQWLRLRREYLDRGPDLAPYSSDDHTLCHMARELVYVIELLEPAQARRFFGFEKRQRRYLCPSCEHECANWDIGVTLAQLQPNTPDSTTVYCILCRQTHTVVREKCNLDDCPGNVISVDYGNCLTCGRSRPDDLDEGDADEDEAVDTGNAAPLDGS
ncbi:Uncharacterized protein OS=Pirellula staleyi (strain ATCC 27377 / DSM 6068 / ICPB 4128) GN=Psta_3436 PE=4 SV=1 [Gemmataceae bacterium]|nr:Uncharacterized protein OS=Pirellula staleyi (strain ATCC 27377 / DSM 6068 / ICPB 4128) GN=Psta_3436 PE=4 SV=1 [Gemmataceae bacterium]VTT99588.1 Uncharacterized protein OS=Pirellula staleyi (strain ATCC 27377 / DSM 6068 / ICPB 4128) GN=Psta_3436 PE=4 SV=1 [Gemmataceae bacterium]